MGTPHMAAHVLERLVGAESPDFEVAGVVTRPDSPRGRHLRLEASEVAVLAARYGLKALKPVKLRNPDFIAELSAFEPDLLVVVAYGRILPRSVIDCARRIALNVHASLLPRHRGASPVEGALLAGDSITGVSIMRIVERMDAGPVLLQREIPIAPDDTQQSLKLKLQELGAEALIEVLGALAHGHVAERAQDESQATYTTVITKAHAAIDWNSSAIRIERMTRAYDPWPVARTTFEGHPLMIYRATVDETAPSAAPPGTIVRIKPVPTVQCGKGQLGLLEVQAAGRKRMAAADFMRGRRVGAGVRLGS